MRRVKATIAYDGTNYAGLQIQPNAITIQGEIERALKNIYGADIRIYASGRTDAGVHALGQVIHFDVEEKIPEWKISYAMNFHLPQDVRIESASYTDDDFHARYSAKKRKYIYIIHNAEHASPFYSKYALHIRKPLNVNLLNEYAKKLIGDHDFTSFCSLADSSKNKTRRVFNCSFTKRGGFIYFYIEATAFLQNMIRIIIGTMLELERADKDAFEVENILAQKNRKVAAATAAPTGLFLKRITY